MSDLSDRKPARRDLSRRGLLGPDEGWSLAPVGAWIMIEGRHIGDPKALLEALAARLNNAGAGIERLGFVVRTIHPQIAAWGCYWSRKNGSGVFTGRHGTQNDDAYVGSPVQYVYENHRPYRRRLEALEERDPQVTHDLRAEGMTDYYAMPLWLGSGEINFITVATARAGGFGDDDLDRFEALANLLAPLIEAIHARRMTLGLLDAFVGPRIGERIMNGQVKRGDGDRIEAAFWYSDLRGFTGLSELLPAPQLLELLNEYFESCAAAAEARGGEILQFIGDAVLIVFEIKQPGQEAAVCEAALDAAIDAFNAVGVANHRRRRAGLPEIEFGLGLHLGEVTHANVGSPGRLAFNVVGPAVNRTARIQALTKETGVPLLLSDEFAARVRHPLRSLGTHDLRGLAGAQEVFTVQKGL
jgi:adenylate cyclase